jgi:glycerol-3-phosphate O-acyltransferase
MSSAIHTPRIDEPCWPTLSGERILFLLDAASALEERLLRAWIERSMPEGADRTGVEVFRIPPSRRRRRRRRKPDPKLEAALAAGENPILAPLRVVWLAEERQGRRSARLSDLLKLGDPRDPVPLREHWVLHTAPERCRIVAGEPAPASELRDRWRRAVGSDAGDTVGIAGFVARQAVLALERAERQLRGNRYKVARFVGEDILSRPAFRGGVTRLARRLGRKESSVAREASRYLREIAASQSPFVIDLVVQLWHLMYSRGYGEALQYDREELERLSALAQRHPVVFLPTHKSNLDHAVLQSMLHENGFPPTHTAGGINMNFFPLGPLVRRSGVFFIRRSFKDNAVYKFVLHHYIDYLIEKRFSLEWYIEGGRSRSGKLLPPHFGLLAYVVDAYRRGKSEDVYLIPVSIAYDQISDVGDYAAEQRGAAKQAESFGWFLRILRRLRRRYGEVHIRFGEPLSLRKAAGPPEPTAEPNADEESLTLQKLAFEVCVRINRATPITPISLVTLAMLGRGDRALSVEETIDALRNLVDYVRKRRLLTTREIDLDTADDVRRTLDQLVENGVLTRYDEGPEAVYAISPDQDLAAAYYRNTVIHYFVNGAIAELALLRAGEEGVAHRPTEFWEEALRLRDLLKFEFFFAEKESFLAEIRQELSLHDPSWEARLERGADAITGLLPRIRPFSSHRILRPFLEAYRVVGDALERRDPAEPLDEAAFLNECLALGKQYSLQRHIKSAESVSKVLFATALKLARNRGLTATGGEELAAKRRAFARQLREAIRRVDAVQALVHARLSGLIE